MRARRYFDGEKASKAASTNVVARAPPDHICNAECKIKTRTIFERRNKSDTIPSDTSLSLLVFDLLQPLRRDRGCISTTRPCCDILRATPRLAQQWICQELVQVAVHPQQLVPGPDCVHRWTQPRIVVSAVTLGGGATDVIVPFAQRFSSDLHYGHRCFQMRIRGDYMVRQICASIGWHARMTCAAAVIAPLPDGASSSESRFRRFTLSSGSSSVDGLGRFR